MRVVVMRMTQWRRLLAGSASLSILISPPSFAQETITYSYDALGRLVVSSVAGGPNNGTQTGTTFDPASNRTSYTVTGTPGPPIAPSFAIGNASPVTEGGILVFTVTRSGSTTASNSVSYSTSNGTATAGSDFVATSGTLTFAPGETAKTITVSTIDDSTPEPVETMLVTLSGPTGGASIATAQGSGTINDNDAVAPPIVTGSYAMTVDVPRPGASGYNDGTVGFGAFGSLTPSSIGGGYAISSVFGAGSRVSQASFTIASTANGAAFANGGWTTITIPGVGSLSRTAASYSTFADTLGRQTAKWTWVTNGALATSGTVVIQ